MDPSIVAAIVVVAVIGVLLMQPTNNSPASGEGAGDVSGPLGLSALAAAIARAENVPTNANNPGALALGDVGYGVFNSAGVSIFPTAEAGLAALETQLTKIENGVAKYLKPSMTLSQFAATWTGNDNAAAWANTVASELGVSTDTTIAEILGDPGSGQ